MLLKNAEKLAILAHLGQTRRDGVTPYIEHPIKVKSIVQNILGLSEEYQAVALVHDSIEDNPNFTASTLIDGGIPLDLVASVILLTKSKDQDYTEYLNELSKNHIAKMVKIADIIANLTDSPTDKQIKKYLPALKVLIS